MSDNSVISEILTKTYSNPDLIIDGINFGRGDLDITSHPNIKCWRIVNENLEEIKNNLNNFYDEETYVTQWNPVVNKIESKIFFYWKGENAPKGYSPLPEEIEKDNPPVERITQWSEPAAFLRLFSGTLMVHKGKHGTLDDRTRLYILRGEIEKETHFYEVPLKRASLRSRTCFLLSIPQEKKVIIWEGARSSTQSRNVIKRAVEKIFKYNIIVLNEKSENEDFLKLLAGDDGDYLVDSSRDIICHTPRLFYLNKITGNFLATEVECSHRSKFSTPFPFLQAHLYTATQPATFLLDDNDEIWLWQGWERDEDSDFRSECFSVTIDYAKQKSRLIGKLVKVHKVIAGFEPLSFTNLFPTWNKREDVAEIQKKDGVVPNTNLLIEVTPEDNNEKAN